MNYYRIALIVAVCFCCFSACKKKAPEHIPAPKTAAVESSTAPSGGILSAPADYVKGLAADVDKAKAAREAMENAEETHLKALQEVNTGGN